MRSMKQTAQTIEAELRAKKEREDEEAREMAERYRIIDGDTISATAIRAKIEAGDETWRDMVPEQVAAIMGAAK